MSNFEDTIRSYVNFSHGVSGQGWNTTYCEYCGDGKRTKGPRAGWMFTDNGNTAFYHCFNCGCNENFSINREAKFSKNMTKVLDSFGIPKNEYMLFLLNNSKEEVKKTIASHYKYIEIPDYISPIKDSNSECIPDIKKFIKLKYGLSINSYGYYYGTGTTNSDDKLEISLAKAMKGRIVIPFYHRGKLIYYQARDITEKSNKKYLMPNIPKSNIIFNVDLLSTYDNYPLYVTEGVFDAIHLNGAAVLGNELSSQQIDLLSKSKKRKILVPDFGGDSNKLAEQFVEQGWEIAIPEFSKQCKDVSESVVKYGKLFTAYDISKNIKSAREANIILNLRKS